MARARDAVSGLLSEYRRPTETWVKVNKRRLHEIGFVAKVLRDGEPRRGSVVLIVQDGVERWRVFSQARAVDGSLIWIEGLSGHAVVESEARSYAHRSIERDPDLWVLEIRTIDSRGETNAPSGVM